jgi:hypothetical protein
VLKIFLIVAGYKDGLYPQHRDKIEKRYVITAYVNLRASNFICRNLGFSLDGRTDRILVSLLLTENDGPVYCM